MQHRCLGIPNSGVGCVVGVSQLVNPRYFAALGKGKSGSNPSKPHLGSNNNEWGHDMSCTTLSNSQQIPRCFRLLSDLTYQKRGTSEIATECLFKVETAHDAFTCILHTHFNVGHSLFVSA